MQKEEKIIIKRRNIFSTTFNKFKYKKNNNNQFICRLIAFIPFENDLNLNKIKIKPMLWCEILNLINKQNNKYKNI